MADREEYVDKGVEALVALADREGAFIWSEAEAKISEGERVDQVPIQPHHLTTARRLLAESGELLSDTAQTRGGHAVEAFYVPDTPTKRFGASAARKRLLQARFLGWATGTKRHPGGLIGPAAERVVLASLERSAAAGYQILPATNRGVEQVYGVDVPGGPLDAAGFLILMDQAQHPVGVALVAIEVKNIRDWIYPNSVELYQLLDKCARMQNEDRGRHIVPVLICRRAHFTTFKMAKALGFYVVDLRRQYLVPSADLETQAVNEVRTELGYLDLVVGQDADPKLIRHFTSHLPKVAPRASAVWSHSAKHLHVEFQQLRVPGKAPTVRAKEMAALRAAAAKHVPTADLVPTARPGGW